MLLPLGEHYSFRDLPYHCQLQIFQLSSKQLKQFAFKTRRVNSIVNFYHELFGIDEHFEIQLGLDHHGFSLSDLDELFNCCCLERVTITVQLTKGFEAESKKFQVFIKNWLWYIKEIKLHIGKDVLDYDDCKLDDLLSDEIASCKITEIICKKGVQINNRELGFLAHNCLSRVVTGGDLPQYCTNIKRLEADAIDLANNHKIYGLSNIQEVLFLKNYWFRLRARDNYSSLAQLHLINVVDVANSVIKFIIANRRLGVITWINVKTKTGEEVMFKRGRHLSYIKTIENWCERMNIILNYDESKVQGYLSWEYPGGYMQRHR